MIRFEALAKCHDCGGFECGEPALDDYLKARASQDVRRKLATAYVACAEDGRAVLGYYTLSSALVVGSSLPHEFQHRLPYEALPATLIGRLAVAISQQRQGLGELLLIDALERCVQQSQVIGSAFIIVQAKHDEAQAFYLHYRFESFVDEPLKLFLPMRTAATLVGR